MRYPTYKGVPTLKNGDTRKKPQKRTKSKQESPLPEIDDIPPDKEQLKSAVKDDSEKDAVSDNDNEDSDITAESDSIEESDESELDNDRDEIFKPEEVHIPAITTRNRYVTVLIYALLFGVVLSSVFIIPSHINMKLNLESFDLSLDGSNLDMTIFFSLFNTFYGIDTLDGTDIIDGENMRNYALRTAGASIVHKLTSPSYCHDWISYVPKTISCWFYQHYKNVIPERAIDPSMNIGDCWSMNGTYGNITIQLIRPRINITHVSIKHPSRFITFNNQSTPKEIEIYGWPDSNNMNGEPIFIHSFTYNIHEKSLQTFEVPKPHFFTHVVLIKINNNWGEKRYTSLYNIGIHGNEM